MPSRLTVPVTFVHVAINSGPKLYWMWLAHLKSPSALAEENHIIGSLEILNLKVRDML